VKISTFISNYLRIFLVSLFIALFGLAPRPHSVTNLFTIANQASASGDFLVASQELAEIGKYFPWRYDLLLLAGRFAIQAGDPKSAIQYFELPGVISRLSPDDLILLGDAYHQSGDSLMAEAIWKHASTLDNSSLAFQRLADIYLQRKDYPSAISVLEGLLRINPADTHLYFQIGSLYAITDPEKSLPFLAQAMQIDKINADHAQDLHDKIRTARLFDNPSYTMLIAGRQFATWGEWELALAAFQNATVFQPDYADAWAYLGEARQHIKQMEDRINSDAGYPDLKQALQLEPDSSLANTFMGLFWERQEAYSQAQNYLERAIAVSPKDPFLYSELGNILSKSGDLPAAQSAYEKAIQLAPQDSLFYRLLAEFAINNQIQIRELALPAARQAVTLNPDDASTLDVMAQVMLLLQDYHSAERYARSAIQTDPSFAPAYLHLGSSYLYLNEPDFARQWLKLAETIDPDSPVSNIAKRMLEYYFP
jgi:tetratricopeptide (TPR) repeat protein